MRTLTPWSVKLAREEVAKQIVDVLTEAGLDVWMRTERGKLRYHNMTSLDPEHATPKDWFIVHFTDEWVLSIVTIARQAESFHRPLPVILKRLFADVREHGYDAIEAMWRIGGREGIVKEIARSFT